MGRTASVEDARLLSQWLRVTPDRQKVSRRRAPAVLGGLRVAFYGRISTGEYQDATSARAWQLDSARQMIAGQGRIVVEYFDAGCSRRLPWTERPEAAALLATITTADWPFDAVVVGPARQATQPLSTRWPAYSTEADNAVSKPADPRVRQRMSPSGWRAAWRWTPAYQAAAGAVTEFADSANTAGAGRTVRGHVGFHRV